MPFKVKNNTQTVPKQLQNNFEKVKKMTLLTPKLVKMTHQIRRIEQNFDFRGYFSTFRAENTPKSRTLKVENKAQTAPKKKIEKVGKNTF